MLEITGANYTYSKTRGNGKSFEIANVRDSGQSR